MARRSSKAQKRISSGLKKFRNLFADAVKKELNEADTRSIVREFLEEILGYDKFSEVTAELMVRGQYVDLAIKLNGSVKFLIELKSPKTVLKKPHLKQAVGYATAKGVEWAVLSNGPIWQVYHVSFKKPIDVQLAFEINLLDEKYKKRTEKLLYLLAKEGMLNNELADYWGQSVALVVPNVLKVMLSEPVLKKIRRELEVMTGTEASLDDIKKVIEEDIVNEAVKEIPAPIVSKRRKRKKKAEPTATSDNKQAEPASLEDSTDNA